MAEGNVCWTSDVGSVVPCQSEVSNLGANGWTVTASATNGGAFTITFTNSSGATMTNVNYRITKLNRTGLG